ncbi:hypothetical protein [Streptomyces sp. NPDC021212]|uniref:hypothetical protein n=1 Tax=Streptomyces sp. NPDC021212 TaxID=3365118 RepID=UPI0037A5DFFF
MGQGEGVVVRDAELRRKVHIAERGAYDARHPAHLMGPFDAEDGGVLHRQRGALPAEPRPADDGDPLLLGGERDVVDDGIPPRLPDGVGVPGVREGAGLGPQPRNSRTRASAWSRHSSK